MRDASNRYRNAKRTFPCMGQAFASAIHWLAKQSSVNMFAVWFVVMFLFLGGSGVVHGQSDKTSLSQVGEAMVNSVSMVPEQVVARTHMAIVQVIGDNCGSSTSLKVGSGWIIDPRGYVVTNYHVIDDSRKFVDVKLFDNSLLPAQLVGADPDDDLAVLKINTPKRLFTLSMGDSSRLQVGESVLALGYPLGVLPQTVTGGLISALDYSTGSVIGATQTDAAINRGNSGGALVNMHAQLIGMPVYTAQQVFPEGLISITIPANGIAFAIPSNRVAFVVPQLIRYGKVLHRGHATIEATGATVVSVDPEVAVQDGLSVDRGALITNVSANSAAARAGLKPGDVIVQVNGTPVDNALAVNDVLMTEDPGSFATLGIVRGSEHVPVRVELQEQKVTPAASTCPPINPGPIRGRG